MQNEDRTGTRESALKLLEETRQNYLIDAWTAAGYCFILFMGLCGFITFFNLVDGFWLNFIAWLALFLMALLGFPALIVRDVFSIKKEVLTHAVQLNEIRKGSGDIGPYQEMLIEKIADRTGMPVLLVGWLVRRGKVMLDARCATPANPEVAGM